VRFLREQSLRNCKQVVRLQPVEVLLGVEQAVGVVNAETVSAAVRDPAEPLAVNRAEHVFALGTQRGQLVHIEKPAVVDLVGRHPPET
jgi:hypothetical protein